MAARKQTPPVVRLWVGDRPIEELTPEEREDWERRAVERMGRALSDYFSSHIEEYKKI